MDPIPALLLGRLDYRLNFGPLKEPLKTTVPFLFPTIATLNTATIARNELSLLLVILYHPASKPPSSKDNHYKCEKYQIKELGIQIFISSL